MMVFLISERRTIIFGNQFIVSTIKFRKGFLKFMILIALLEKFGR